MLAFSVRTATRMAAAVVLAAFSANDDIHAPQIGSVVPDRAIPGAQVQINGDYFCAQPEPEPGEEEDPLRCDHVGSVRFGTVDVQGSLYTDATILVDVPVMSPGTVDVRVAVAGRMSNAVAFTIESAP